MDWDPEVLERLAEARHEIYLRDQAARGEGPDLNPSLVPWAGLSDSLKRSNRAFAAAIPEKLAALGVVAAPAGEGRSLTISPPQLERLAREEHDRWRRDLEADGWHRGPEHDPAGKAHPMLVEWAELPEAEREKDRDAVRALPELLRQVGLDLRPDPGRRR
jgi:hypothetical protein